MGSNAADPRTDLCLQTPLQRRCFKWGRESPGTGTAGWVHERATDWKRVLPTCGCFSLFSPIVALDGPSGEQPEKKGLSVLLPSESILGVQIQQQPPFAPSSGSFLQGQI